MAGVSGIRTGRSGPPGFLVARLLETLMTFTFNSFTSLSLGLVTAKSSQ